MAEVAHSPNCPNTSLAISPICSKAGASHSPNAEIRGVTYSTRDENASPSHWISGAANFKAPTSSPPTTLAIVVNSGVIACNATVKIPATACVTAANAEPNAAKTGASADMTSPRALNTPERAAPNASRNGLFVATRPIRAATRIPTGPVTPAIAGASLANTSPTRGSLASTGAIPLAPNAARAVVTGPIIPVMPEMFAVPSLNA